MSPRALLVAVPLLLTGCLDHELIAPSGRRGALQLAVSASGAADEVLDVTVYYHRADGSRATLPHVREPLGNGSNESRAVPTPVSGGAVFTEVHGGAFVSCGLTTAGATLCWGDNELWALGSDVCTNRVGEKCASFVPVPVSGGHRFTALSVALWRACGLDAAGAAYCWGNALAGESGQEPTATPVAVGGSLRFTALTVGPLSTCGVDMDGRTFCWGINYSGELGTGATASESVPREVAGDHRFGAVVTSDENNIYAFSCGLESAGATWCWGANQVGQLGAASSDTCEAGEPIACSRVPVAVSGGHAFADIAIGIEHACGVTTGGVLYCWGGNAQGQLGDGTQTNRATPTRVLPPR